MGKKCCTCLPRFRAIFRPQDEGDYDLPECTGPKCLPRPPTTEEPGEGSRVSILTITNVDPCFEENGKSHRTWRYDLMSRRDGQERLVLRRGQEFYLECSLSRDYDPEIDGISLVFTLDGVEKPQYGHGTLVATPVLETRADFETPWQATVVAYGRKFIRIQVISPANANIGKWKMDIDTRNKLSDGALSFTVEQPFYILFNPWSRDDTVYLPDEAQREEYVMAEDGLIWRGSYKQLQPTVWKYSQFQRDVLDCALHLMIHVVKTRVSGRNDPVVISRVLSAAVNANNDDGVVMGRWEGNFEGGKAPTKWLGSHEILKKYYKTKEPVKYGQCWVFSGVLATVCRTLGIPCRVVTNYQSAHDTEGSLTVDYFIGTDGEVLKELAEDSIWNFHVWNEVWMKRLDLSPEYSGWQAIDATPQELSKEGEQEPSFRCGPSPVTAVKKGEILRPYDTAFLYSEVNADIIYWRYNGPTQPLKLLHKREDSIGQFISTKAVGRWTREDITYTYKHPESTPEERNTMLTALKQSQSTFSRYYLNDEFNDVTFSLELRDDILIGQPFSVVLLMKNKSPTQSYRASIILRVDTALYTGQVGDAVKKLHTERFLEPTSSKETRMDVLWKEYGPRVLDQCAFNISCLATIKGTNFEYAAQDDFRVRKPNIEITLEDEPIVGQTLNVTAKFKNPLPIPLKKGKFIIQGPGLTEQVKIKLSENVRVDGFAECFFSMIPDHEGRATIATKFYSANLDDVDGFINFMVKPGGYSVNEV